MQGQRDPQVKSLSMLLVVCKNAGGPLFPVTWLVAGDFLNIQGTNGETGGSVWVIVSHRKALS